MAALSPREPGDRDLFGLRVRRPTPTQLALAGLAITQAAYMTGLVDGQLAGSVLAAITLVALIKQCVALDR